MGAASWRPRRARKPESASYSTICETPAAKSRRPSQRGATDEEAPQTPVLTRCDCRRRLRRTELSAGAFDGARDRPDRLRRRLDTLAGLQQHEGKGVYRYSKQACRNQALSSAKTKC